MTDMDTAIDDAECPTYQQQMSTPSRQPGTIPWSDLERLVTKLSGGKLITLAPFHYGKAAIFLMRIGTYHR